MEEDFDWISAREVNVPTKTRTAPKLDKEVSHILGKPVMLNDPRLIRLVVKWKKQTNSSVDSEKPDNFLHTTEFLADLKKEFNYV